MNEGVVTMVEAPIFVKKTHELAGLLKRVKYGSAKAVDILIDTMEDKNTEPKLKVACAQSLIEYEVKITDQINKDQLVRQVAEIKAKGLSTPLRPEDKALSPTVDFSRIQEV
jgi:hypothetical protein